MVVRRFIAIKFVRNTWQSLGVFVRNDKQQMHGGHMPLQFDKLEKGV